MSGQHQQGVGAVLTINGDTRAMKQFLEAIPQAYGQVVPNSQVHVTLVDFGETALDIVSDSDLTVLSNASVQMAEYLGYLPLRQMVFHRNKYKEEDKGELKPFGRFLGVEIEPCADLEHLRAGLGKIIKKEIGIDIIDGSDFRPHMSVVEQPKSKSRRVNPKGYSPVIPVNLHVNGYDVGKRTFTTRVPTASVQRYANRPSGLRR